jgi:hypothetical protein
MKKPALLFLVTVISSFVSAQSYPSWTEPVAFTDSLTINSNPAVLTIPENSLDVFCFYEKKLSPGQSTQIWYRNIYTMEEEQLLLMADNSIYQNPQVLITSYYGGRYFVFCESNISGNFEIYAMEFFEDGAFGDPIQLTNTEEDETSFYISESVYGNGACWKIEDSIQFANIVISNDVIHFGEIKTVDSGGCFDPICSENMVFYRKIVNDSSHLYFSKFNSITNLWSEPDTIFATGNNINLKMGKYTEWYYEDESICWENNGKVIGWDAGSEEIILLDFPGVTGCFEPSYLTFILITDNFPSPAVFTFCSGEGENREIFTSMDYYSEPQNLSNNNYSDSQPRMFYGQIFSYYLNAINIWQTLKNNNSVLYMSQISIGFGGEKEKPGNSGNRIMIYTSPNPFKELLNIEYYLSNSIEVSIDIYSLSGNHIDHINTKNHSDGWNTHAWNPADELPAGIYFVVLTQRNERAVRKVIYNR